MIPLLLSLALAADPVADSQPPPVPESVDAVLAVEHAQQVSLTEPATYRMRGDHPSFDRGVILRLRVEAGMGRARQIDQPVLYVGEWPARVLHASEAGTCLVAWAPLTEPLAQTPIFFGSRLLPERVDAERGRAELEAAVAAGARPLGAAHTEPARVLPSSEAIWTIAGQLAQTCEAR